jgi:hypothetical protein
VGVSDHDSIVDNRPITLLGRLIWIARWVIMIL